MCEYCVRFEECGCKCEKTDIRMGNHYCYECTHFVNIDKKHYNERYKNE
jgi:hypothetical protein